MPIVTEPAQTKTGKTVKKVNSILFRKLGWIGVLLVSGVYLFWGFFSPSLKDKSLWEILLSAAVSMVVALSISNLLGFQGLIAGGDDEDVIALKKEHIKAVEEANVYVEYSDEWAEEENKIALKTARKHIMMSGGLKYEIFFDANGDFLETQIEVPSKDATPLIKKRYKEKLATLNRALKYKITPITMARISAETSVDLDPNKLAPEPAEYQKIKGLQSVWQKITSVAVFGWITLKIVTDTDWKESLFNGAIQVAVFILFGVISFYTSYVYMTDIYTGNLRKKINLLKRLKSFGMKQEAINNGNRQSAGTTATTTQPSGTAETVQPTTSPVLV